MDQRSQQRSLLDPSREYPREWERRAAWQAFTEESGPFRAAFEHAAIGMAIVDLDGHFLQVNPAMAEIVGYTQAELLATDFQSITHPDDLDTDIALARQLMSGEIEHYHMEKRYLHKRGHVVWILLSASIARDKAGRACFAISQIQDISDRKSAEHESARRLRHIDRLTQSVRAILQAVARGQGPALYASVVRILLKTFESPAGLFLRRPIGEELLGPYVSPSGVQEVQCSPAECCEPWRAALECGVAVNETGERTFAWGLTANNSLTAPILNDGDTLGLFYVANAPQPYDDDDRDLLLRIGAIIGPALFARMQRDKLTPREAEVMDLLVAGRSQKQIATILNISVQTTAKHRTRILDKLDLSSDVELVHLALQMKAPWTADGLSAAPSQDGHPSALGDGHFPGRTSE